MATTHLLPSIVLSGRRVSASDLAAIPYPTAAKFQIVAFEESNQVLKLAIVHPEQLKEGFYESLIEIGKRIDRKIELYKTDAASLKSILTQYKTLNKQAKAEEKSGGSGSWPTAPKPPLFELGKLVAYNYLRRIPLDFSKKERVLCVDFLKPTTYWFVTDGSNNQRLERAIDYISKNNQVSIHVLIVKPKELDELLAYYSTLERQGGVQNGLKEEALDKAQQEAQEKEIEQKLGELNTPKIELIQDKKLADDVVIPGIQAEIVSTEEEKHGLAGFIQKISQNLVAQDSSRKQENVPYTPPPGLNVIPPIQDPIPVKQDLAPVGLPAPSFGATATAPAPPPPPPPPASSSAPTPLAQSVGLSDAPSKPAAPPDNKDDQPVAIAHLKAGNNNEEDIGKLLDKHVTTSEELKAIIRAGNVPQIVAAIVSFSIHEKASDVHMESFEDEVRVRYRVDGQLVDIVKLPPDIHNAMVSRIKILARLRLDENRIPQDGRFDVNFDGDVQVDVRVSVMPTVHGEKVVLRILDKSRGITNLEKLGIEGIAYERLTKAIQKPYGICLSTGPTGSGKSTTLYAILTRIATPNVNAITLEDPIEYEIKGVNQSQIRPKIGYTFAEGLRSILRQDPNIIMVGEIRDGETANMATQAALTGHLVLSTLHTNDASGAIPRLTNMGIEPFLITSSLNMVLAQRLVRKICSNCKREVSLPSGVRARFERDIEEIGSLNEFDATRITRPISFYQGTGCAECGGKGYQGRVGIFELLTMDDDIVQLTIDRASANQITEAARKKGMLTLYQDGLLKATAGITTIDEVLRETSN